MFVKLVYFLRERSCFMKPKALLIPHNLYSSFRLLTDEECGKLFKAVFDYDVTGQEAEFEDVALTILYIQLKNILDYNHDRYEKICKKRSEIAKKRWDKAESFNAGEDSLPFTAE